MDGSFILQSNGVFEWLGLSSRYPLGSTFGMAETLKYNFLTNFHFERA